MRPTAEEDINFIETDLLPEMVHNRCFCEPGSREFVEFISAKIEPLKKSIYHLDFAYYQASVVVEFSGEPETFHILIKLLPEDPLSTNEPSLALAFDAFLNEEILWNKMTLHYGKDCFPKFYLADMGRYGRPVIVLENLEKYGFEQVVGRGLNKKEAQTVLELIGKFHGKGMRLKENKYSVYREFQVKFTEIKDTVASSDKEQDKNFTKYLNDLKSNSSDKDVNNKIEKINDYISNENLESLSTICQGFLIQENLWFKKNKETDEITEVRMLDWQRVRHALNTIDLATVLLQCETDVWQDLIKIYCENVCKEQNSITSEELREKILNYGLVYAVYILSAQNNNPSYITKILSFLKDS